MKKCLRDCALHWLEVNTVHLLCSYVELPTICVKFCCILALERLVLVDNWFRTSQQVVGILTKNCARTILCGCILPYRMAWQHYM